MSTLRHVPPHRKYEPNGEYKGYRDLLDPKKKKTTSARYPAKGAPTIVAQLRANLICQTPNHVQKQHVRKGPLVADDAQWAEHTYVHENMRGTGVRPRARDEEIGRRVVARIESRPTGRSQVLPVTNIELSTFLKELSMHEVLSISSEYPWCYRRGGQPKDIIQQPVVLFSETLAVGSDAIVPFGHGFAYVAQPLLDKLQHLGKFHVFNKPQSTQDVLEKGKTIKIKKYFYSGLYVAHRSPLSMSPEGWHDLPEGTKQAVTWIYSCDAASTTDRALISQEAYRHHRQQLDSGAIRLPLVLLECIEFNSHYAAALNKASAMTVYPVQRAATRPKLPSPEEFYRMEQEEERAKAMKRAASRGQTLNAHRAPRS
ncbi:hypothetical protein OH77DRAFT_1521120 [Trametes cingulata]|nr:hypothetical protein OH77DRAFT_1521120 [Trametes cingulata]